MNIRIYEATHRVKGRRQVRLPLKVKVSLVEINLVFVLVVDKVSS